MKPIKKFVLTEQEMPTQWYNIVADMPNRPLPPLHPGTKQPLKPEDLYPLFAQELAKQEFATERYIEIPDEVQDLYKIWRSTPLVRAYALEKALDTPAKIYFKNEGTSPAGSHKPNTAIAQAYYNYKQGIKRITTETGGGQWGTALSFEFRLSTFRVRPQSIHGKSKLQPETLSQIDDEHVGSRCDTVTK